LFLSREELSLSHAVEDFRRVVKSRIAVNRRDERAGSFAVEILSKRLLSSTWTFAESWHRFLDGARGDEADVLAVRAAQLSLEEDIEDDREIESRAHHAVKTVGAWLKPMLPEVVSSLRNQRPAPFLC
jgi:hypothetical protein